MGKFTSMRLADFVAQAKQRSSANLRRLTETLNEHTWSMAMAAWAEKPTPVKATTMVEVAQAALKVWEEKRFPQQVAVEVEEGELQGEYIYDPQRAVLAVRMDVSDQPQYFTYLYEDGTAHLPPHTVRWDKEVYEILG